MKMHKFFGSGSALGFTRPGSCSMVMAAALTVQAPLAHAGCGIDDRGSPHADDSGATRLIVTQRAHTTWQDWFWRGINNGQNARCPDNNAGPCKFTWANAIAKSTTIGFGGGVTGGFRDAKWWQQAQSSLQAAFNFTYQRQTTKTDTYTIETSYGPGWFAEPIMVQTRRWEKGYFQGGWVQTSAPPAYIRAGARYCYNFDASQSFGEWTSNVAEGAPYRTFNIHR